MARTPFVVSSGPSNGRSEPGEDFSKQRDQQVEMFLILGVNLLSNNTEILMPPLDPIG